MYLRQQYEQMLLNAYQADSLANEDGVDNQFVGDEIPKNSHSAEDKEDEGRCFDPSALPPSTYSPYPSKTARLLDIMVNLPRCRFTGVQMSLIIKFARDLGVPDVPSLKALRNIQQSLQSSCGGGPTRIASTQGNIFYMNDILDTIARDLANPLVAPHMHFYPEEPDGPISEVYQAERWTEYAPERLTPMFTNGHRCFWINEVARLQDGTFAIPVLLIVQNGHLEAEVLVVTLMQDGKWNLCADDLKSVEADTFKCAYNDLVQEFGDFTWDLFVVMVSPWADDVSGNRSKQYNKHMYTGNGCLPGRLLQQEFHVHYVSSSPHASSAEQFTAFRDHTKSTETKPVKAYNAATKRKCRCILRVPGLPADNPQQSEEASHMGSRANFPCRKCHWGGTEKEKEMDKVYHECHVAGALRSADKICINLQAQLRLAMRGDGAGVLQLFMEQPGDKMNPLLDIAGLDSSQDTPLELLHTILLGVIKYIWHHMNTEKWSDTDRHLLAICLQSTDLGGVTVPPICAAYMMTQYRNNLIGKHFKTLMQILPFHISDISTPEQFTLIKAVGELGARLWVPEIDNMDEYLAQIEIAVANLLDAFDAVDPLQILTKIKLHLLSHMVDDVHRFGPLIRSSTEIYRAFNGVFRLCSVYSNHLAPSRDISRKFALMSRIKHFLSGGYWWDSRSERWVQAGHTVQAILQTDRTVQRHLGWVSPATVTPGTVERKPLKYSAIQWQQSAEFTHWNVAGGTPPQPQSLWRFGRSLSAQSGDTVATGSWVAAKDHQGQTVFGCIKELLTADKTVFVTLEQFFVISVQHDCWIGHCEAAVAGKEQQEREDTSRDRELIKHTDDDHFILNMSALHNFTKLCRALPKALTELTLLVLDRNEFHKKAAREARAGRETRRKKTAAKHRQNAEAKKKQAEEADRAAREAEDLEDSDRAESDASDGEGDVEPGPDSEPREEMDDEEFNLRPDRGQRGRKQRRT
ncbi:hypothetical protein C8R43DRAFT_1092894 [Mycena crocata]|nr:hypothetical protein C8R43DRAFT_1092894 [Mycena crocata]